MQSDGKVANAPVIPRVIHRIWFGDKVMPEEYEKYWKAWQRQLPDFEFRTWREADVADFRTSELLERAEGMARKADIARYEILLRHGGIYMDCDIFPLQPLNLSLLQHDLVVCNESDSTDYCSIGFIASVPGNPALQWAVDAVMQRPINRLSPNVETGPWLFGQAVAHSPHVRLPVHAFYPYLYNEPLSSILDRDLSGTFGVHVWGGSWLNEQQRLNKLIERLNRGDLEEATGLAAQGGPDDPHEVGAYCALARDARRHALAAARHKLMESQVRIDNSAPLDFVKSAFALLSQSPDMLVWHIGAADGLLNGAVRGLLANFDPRAVLVEPNPYLHDMLTQNYRNNGRATLLQAALSRDAAPIVFNAVNPAIVRKARLPEAFLGMSAPASRGTPFGDLRGGDPYSRRISRCFEQISCPAVTVQQLLDVHNGEHPGIVAIDAQGAALDVVAQLVDSGIHPLILQLQPKDLPDAELDALARLLESEYVTVKRDDEVVAYRADFFSTYCEYIYIENGIHTIYKDALRFVLNLS